MNHLNDIDTKALTAFTEQVLAEPVRGKADYAVISTWSGQTRVTTKTEPFVLGGQVHNRQFQINADEPHSLLGTNSAPSPAELLFAGINSCLLITFVANAALRGISLESVSIRAEGSLDLRGFLDPTTGDAPGFTSIALTFQVKGSGSQADYDALLETVRRSSPNYFNLSQPVKFNATVESV
jgi:uncharacterized OsmC-like protein